MAGRTILGATTFGKVIVAVTTVTDRGQLLAAGMDAHLAKPLKAEALRRTMQNLGDSALASILRPCSARVSRPAPRAGRGRVYSEDARESFVLMSKLIFGCGYLGERVATLWLRQTCRVHAVTRSATRADVLVGAGLRPVIGDILAPATLRGLPQTGTVLYAVGYERASGRSMHEVYVDGLRNVLAALPPGTGRIIYVSSTGVYGQVDDGWVDEESPCRPSRDGGAACLEAEQLLATSRWGPQSLILRMGGIYGPGRIPRRRELEAGRPVTAPATGYLNLVHVDDAARAVLTAEADTELPQRYCLTDGNPVLRAEYYRHLAHLLGAPEPRFVAAPADAPVSLRAGSSKRVSSERFRRRFDFRFEYPSYREGLAAIIAAERA